MSLDWVDLLWMLGVPIIQQALKLVVEHFGITLDKWANQLIALIFTVGVLLLGGDFAGLVWCGWSDDLMLFIGCNLAAVWAAWSLVSQMYEVVWDRLFTTVSKATPLRLVTKDKL